MDTFADVNLFCQITLLLSAVLLNALFVVSTRGNKQNLLVATEVLQRCKTIQVIICIILFVPIEVYVLYSQGTLTTVQCLVRDFLEKLLMGLIPSGYLALAILRFKVWKCIGIASAIMKNKSAYTILMLCYIVPVTMAATSLILSISLQKDELEHNITFSKCIGHSFKALGITTVVFVDIIPVVMTVSIYWKLHREIKRRANSDSIQSSGRGRTTAMTRSILKDIEKSLLSFLIILVLTWIPYVGLKNTIFLVDYNPFPRVDLPTLYVYNIIFVCFCHPFAEGICLKHRRIKLRLAWNRLMKKNKIGLQPRGVEKSTEVAAFSTTDKEVAGCVSQRVLQTVVEEDSFKEDADIKVNSHSVRDSNNMSMLNFYEMESESKSGDTPVEVTKENVKEKNPKVSEVVVRVDHHFSSSSESDSIKLPCISNYKGYLSPNTLPNTTESSVWPNIIIQHTKHEDGNHTNIRCSQTSEPLRLLSTSSSSVIVSRNLSSLSDHDNFSAFSMTSHNSMPCNCRRCTRQRKLSNRSIKSILSETSSGMSCRKQMSRCSKSSSIPESLKRVSFTTRTDSDIDALSLISDCF